MSVLLPPVLVVDDEKNMRLSLQTVLKSEDYAARAVESAFPIPCAGRRKLRRAPELTHLCFPKMTQAACS